MSNDILNRLRGLAPSIMAMRDGANEIERLRADRDRLAAELAEAVDDSVRLATQVDKLEAQLAEARRDAERYRWLRDGEFTHEWERDNLKTKNGWLLIGDELDAAIDAAIAADSARPRND